MKELVFSRIDTKIKSNAYLEKLKEKRQINKFRDIEKEKESETLQQSVLPKVPDNRLDWTLKVRPTVDGKPNIVKFLPMLQQLHEDDWYWIMILFARQMTKSAYFATDMAYSMTKQPNQRVVYCTFEDEALSVFSNEKWREALWAESEIARKYVVGSTLGSVSYLRTHNNSSARLVTHANDFHHVESKSADSLSFDEGQNLNLDEWVRAAESQSFTNGKFKIGGIGGWEDTEYEKWWHSTDQRKFIFSDKLWREKLEFNQDGLVIDEYLNDVCDGHWKAQVQKNQTKHGYFSNQYQAPWIPLKKSDCEKYKLPESRSIQYKQEHYPQNDFIRHVLAGFVTGDKKPFPTTLIEENVYDHNLSLQKPSEVNYELGDLFLGTDWGGGNRTAKWIYQVENDEYPRFRLINAKLIETSDVHEQYEEVAEWIDTYEISRAVVDAGGGTHQVQELQKEYGDLCIRFNPLTRPGTPHPKLEEVRKFRRENRTMRDKTWMMEYTKDLMTHPFVTGMTQVRRMVWPAKDLTKIEWITKQFANELTERVKFAGSYYFRYYTDEPDKRPDDILQAQNYSIEAWRLGPVNSGPTTFTTLEPKSPFGDVGNTGVEFEY